MWQALIPIATTLIDKVIPDPKAKAEAQLELVKLQQAGEFKALEADLQMALAQTRINEIEAGSADKVKSYWRPATGWVCVFGLAYQFLAQPILPWVMVVFGFSVPPLPPIDNETLTTLLFALLGIGGFRSFEKIRGAR